MFTSPCIIIEFTKITLSGCTLVVTHPGHFATQYMKPEQPRVKFVNKQGAARTDILVDASGPKSIINGFYKPRKYF